MSDLSLHMHACLLPGEAGSRCWIPGTRATCELPFGCQGGNPSSAEQPMLLTAKLSL